MKNIKKLFALLACVTVLVVPMVASAASINSVNAKARSDGSYIDVTGTVGSDVAAVSIAAYSSNDVLMDFYTTSTEGGSYSHSFGPYAKDTYTIVVRDYDSSSKSSTKVELTKGSGASGNTNNKNYDTVPKMGWQHDWFRMFEVAMALLFGIGGLALLLIEIPERKN